MRIRVIDICVIIVTLINLIALVFGWNLYAKL